MQPQLQRRIQRYGWDRAVPYYEEAWQSQLAPAQNLLLAMANLQPAERVLDVACGTGLVTFRAAAQVGGIGEVLGTDISEKMLVRAREIAMEKNLAHVQFLRMEAEAYTSSENYFDAALCALGFMYVPDPVRALAEMHRALRPGGRAVAAVWGQRSRCGWAEIFPIVEARVHTDVCPLFFQLGTGDALQQTFAAAGFGELACQRIATTLYYDSDASALAAAFAGGPVALAYSRFDENMRAAAHAEYLASIAAYRRTGGYEIPGEFVVVRGQKAQS